MAGTKAGGYKASETNKRKYGNDIEEILKYRDEIEEEIEKIENSEEYILKLKKELNIIVSQMKKIAVQINAIRVKYAKELSDNINKELVELEMKNATLNVKVEMNAEDIFYEDGQDKVEFFISTNIGEEDKPLIKIASGGEMSRIMLAIKTVLSEVDKVPVLVFDEIDTGISGKAALAVSQKLTKIATSLLFILLSPKR